MKKNILLLLMLGLSTFMVACGGNNSSQKNEEDIESEISQEEDTSKSLEGNWEEKEKGDSYQAGYIHDDIIEIFWISDGGDTKALYWSGSYTAPDNLDNGYSWDSINNKEKTATALLASGDDTKTFTYENGEIVYKASALGTTKTMHLVPTDTDYSEKQDSESREGLSDTPTNPENYDIEVMAEYTLPDSIGWYTRHFIIIKNNSEETIDISTSSLAYSEDGTMVGAADSSFDALGSGCTSVLYEAFETDADIDYYETEINTSKSEYFDSIIQDLSYEQNNVDKGAVFQVTNTGEDAGEFVEGHALFFLNGELVGYESTYFTDNDSEIKPGKTISKQMTCYENFDTIEFYLTGRK